VSKSLSDARGSERLRVGLIPVALTIATSAVYWQTLDFDFINSDDHTYITENYRVQQGLTGKNLVWAFTSMSVSNWHPLAWLSHMLDIELYGLDPWGHHLSNFLLHLANALLVFGLLRSLTGALWRSAGVAALFALHPLHVESVAWVAERKDVLCGFFWFLTMWSYGRQARSAELRAPKLTLPLVFATCALLAKPMAVTLPFVLLLLDYWPLNRLRWSSIGPRLAEKLPFFALSLTASLLTMSAQGAGGAMESGADVGLALRLSNAVVAYVAYLAKCFWPLDLGLLYPHPYIAGTGGTPWETWQVAGSVGLLLLVSSVVLAARRAYFTFGWLWYLGTLVPVIGIVQVGTQAFADRYSYLPLIGVFIALIWGLVDLASRCTPRLAVSSWFGPVLLLVGCLVLGRLSWLQASHWRASIPLFEHTLAVTGDNTIIHLALASSLLTADRPEEAKVHAKRALVLRPDYAEAVATIASIQKLAGRHEQALRGFRHAVSLAPTSAILRFNLANQLRLLDNTEAAIRQYLRASELDPTWPRPHYGLGQVMQDLERHPEAISHYQTALAIHPGLHEARVELAKLLLDLGRPDEAILHYQFILDRDSDHVKARYGLDLARKKRGSE
jgi:tetratricopeptide (TPR) repeat protein